MPKGRKRGILALKSRDMTCYQGTVFPGVTPKDQQILISNPESPSALRSSLKYLRIVLLPMLAAHLPHIVPLPI